MPHMRRRRSPVCHPERPVSPVARRSILRLCTRRMAKCARTLRRSTAIGRWYGRQYQQYKRYRRQAKAIWRQVKWRFGFFPDVCVSDEGRIFIAGRGGGFTNAEPFVHVLKREPCAYCNLPATTIDHIIPRSAGGTDSAYNYTPACVACNQEKRSAKLIMFLVCRQLGIRPLAHPLSPKTVKQLKRQAVRSWKLGQVAKITVDNTK